MQQQVGRPGFESGPFHRRPWDEGSYALRQLVSDTAVWHVD
ncbi:hypothetical protein [Leptothermofonsia sichuanensis]|nr:hypothetical protein [Leptothermofonsia sichuanensis]